MRCNGNECGDPTPAPEAKPPYDVTGGIIAFESGELDMPGVLELFGHLVRTGMAWTLQGSYGRMAASLIEQGHLSRSGEVLTEF